MRLHTVYFPDQEWAAVQTEAKRQEVSAAYLIRRCLSVYIAGTVLHRSTRMSRETSAATVKIKHRVLKGPAAPAK
jgi:hypothetical protein